MQRLKLAGAAKVCGWALLAVVGAGAGCAGKGGLETLDEMIERLDWAMTPSLPSPDSGTYARLTGKPRDPVIGALVRDLTFDRSLEAAAAGLALNAVEGFGGITRWELREALWRGGWPYPVHDARGWSAAGGEAPPEDTFRWLEATQEGDVIGLVRARGRMGDGWVGMRAHPEVDLGSVPRSATLGTQITLPAIPGAIWRVSDGGGQLYEGTLEVEEPLLLSSAGEWLVQILQDGRELARFPVYVEIAAPEAPLLRTPRDAPLIGTAADADRWARDLLKHVRATYRLPAWETHPLLEAVARKLVEDPSRPAADLLTGVGFRGADALVWTCDDVTVENCLDRLIWDPRRRAGLLSTELDSVGMSVRLDARGVHMLMLLADG